MRNKKDTEIFSAHGKRTSGVMERDSQPSGDEEMKRDCTEPELMTIEAYMNRDVIESFDDGNGGVVRMTRGLTSWIRRRKDKASENVRNIAERILEDHR